MSNIQVKLTKDGPVLSKIVSGVMSWGIWGKKYSTSELQQLIEQCVEAGVTSFDHADIYGHYTTEAEWGKAFKSSSIERDQIQIITKCGIQLITPNRPEIKYHSYNTRANHILQSVENSLRYLNTDFIDVLLIHRPDPLMNAQEIANTIEKLKSTGKVRYFGVSNFTKDQFELLNAFTPLVTNQIEASLLHLDPIYDGTLDQCQRLGIRPMAWSPIGSGKIFQHEQEDILAIRTKLEEICNRYDQKIRLDQLLLAWLMKLPSGAIPVIGSGKIERIKKAVEACSFEIKNEDWFELLEVARGHPLA